MKKELQTMLGEIVTQVTGLPFRTLRVLRDLLTKLSNEDSQQWLVELKKFLRKESCWVVIVNETTVGEPKTIKTKPFEPTKFLGEGWTIWRGPADGDGLSGEEDVCPKAMAIMEVELVKFVFKNCLKEGENSITGEEKIRRLNEMSDFIGFGPNVFLSLWEDYQTNKENKENKENSALEWLHRNRGVTSMDFPGVILRHPDGYRRMLCLSRHDSDSDSDSGIWDCHYKWLASQCYVGDNSVGCAS